MSMEEYEIACLKREADEEREPFKKLYATKEFSVMMANIILRLPIAQRLRLTKR